jgi:hypothetical protein
VSSYATYLSRALDAAIHKAWIDFRDSMATAVLDAFLIEVSKAERTQGFDSTLAARQDLWIAKNCTQNIYVYADGTWVIATPAEAPRLWVTNAPVWAAMGRRRDEVVTSDPSSYRRHLREFMRDEFIANFREPVLFDYEAPDFEEGITPVRDLALPTPLRLVQPGVLSWRLRPPSEQQPSKLQPTTIADLEAADGKDWAVIDITLDGYEKKLDVVYRDHIPDGVTPLAYFVSEELAHMALCAEQLDSVKAVGESTAPRHRYLPTKTSSF